MSAHTVTAIPTQTIKSISLVGNVVTWKGEQFKCHSVEGYDYYAFVSSGVDNAVTCDFAMTPSEYRREPLALLLPMGAAIRDGLGLEVRVREIRKGVSLAKL